MSEPSRDALLDYVTARDQQRLERAAAMWTALSEREQALVKEAAVMGYVRGAMAAGGSKVVIPNTRDLVIDVLLACDAMDDLYPRLAGLARPASNHDAHDSEGDDD